MTERRATLFNTDQGSQFTDDDFTAPFKAKGVRVSMDGKGRWTDNVFVERLWRRVKYEIYLHRTIGMLHTIPVPLVSSPRLSEQQQLQCDFGWGREVPANVCFQDGGVMIAPGRKAILANVRFSRPERLQRVGSGLV